MKTRLLGCLLWVVSSPLWAGKLPVDPAAAAALDDWLAYQVTIETWAAPVKQVRALKSLARPLISTGSVTYARPGRFRWQLGDPPRTLVIGTAAELLIAYPKLKQLERYEHGAQIDPTLRQVIDLLVLGFPSSAATFRDRYVLVRSRLNDAEEPIRSFELQPKNATSGRFLALAVLDVRAFDQRLMATEFHFPDGSSMRNEFAEPVVNGLVEDARFQLNVPDGWLVSEPLVD